MPLYNFVCKECKKEIERVCRYSEITAQECKECGGELEKSLSAPNTFKFTGVKGSVTMK